MGRKKQERAALEPVDSGVSGEIESILEERGKTHGDFLVQAWIAQELKSSAENGPNWPMMSADKREAIHLVLHKISRIVCGDPEFEDHYADICGYMQLILNNIRGKK